MMEYRKYFKIRKTPKLFVAFQDNIQRYVCSETVEVGKFVLVAWCMPTCGMLLQWASNMENQLTVLM